jgi:hypothetical protein
MARRLVNTTIKNHKDTFTVELWDMVSNNPDLDHVCEFDVNGFDITWDSGSGDKNELVGSTCDWTMFMNEAVRSAVMPVAFSSDEFRLCVRILKGSTPWWCGIVHAENVVEEIGDGIITVSFSASDGLGILDNYDFKQDDGSKYSGSMSAAELIWEALRKLPHTSLYALTGYEVLREWPIPRPVTQNGGEVFSIVTTAGPYGTLDFLQTTPNTFYHSSQGAEHSMFTDTVLSREKYRPNKHTSSKKVVQDIMASLGSSICFAEGRWNVFDRKEHVISQETSVEVVRSFVTASGDLDTSRTKSSADFVVYDHDALIETGFTAAAGRSQLAFRKGASRKGLYPYSGATQKHVDAGSDLLYNNGIGYASNTGEFNRTNVFNEPGFNQPLFHFVRNGNGASVPTLQRSFGKDAQWEWIGCEFPAPDNADVSLRGLFGLYGLNDRDNEITDINLPDGNNDGKIRIHMSGDIQYTPNRLVGLGVPDAEGSLMIYKTRVEAWDGTQWMRLNRPVRTLTYDSDGNDADINISGSGRYQVKFWTGVYEWVSPASSRWADSWLDIPLGANEGILEEGTSTKFMQTDYPAIDAYTPPMCALDGSSDNELTVDDSTDRRMFVWRHDHIYDLPTTNNITKLRIQSPIIEEWQADSGPNMLYNSSGTELSIGTHSGFPTYRTTTSLASFNTGNGVRPNAVEDMQFSGAEIYYGDGSREFDAVATCFPDTQNGKEVVNLTSTRLGASFNNTGKATNNRWTSSDYINPTTQEDNLKFTRDADGTFIKESLGALVTNNVMQVRGVMRQLINGEMFQLHDGRAASSILYPYQSVFVRNLDAATLRIVPTSLTYSLLDSAQQLEGIVGPASAEGNIATTDEYQEDGVRGPSRKPTLSKPDNSDLSDFVTTGSQTGGTGGGTGTGGQFGDIFPIFIKRF